MARLHLAAFQVSHALVVDPFCGTGAGFVLNADGSPDIICAIEGQYVRI